MTQSVSQKKVTFDPDTVEISEIFIGNLIAKGFSNHAFKKYDFSHFIPNSYPSVVLAHANETSRIWHEIFVHLNFKCLQQLHNEEMVEGFPLIMSYEGFCNGCLVGENP